MSVQATTTSSTLHKSCIDFFKKYGNSSVIVCILLFAAVSRFLGMSQGTTFHPDERFMVMVTNDLHWGDMNPKAFAYGSFPFYLLWFTAHTLGFLWPNLASYDGLFLVGRGLAVLSGVLGIYLTYCLGKRLYSFQAGLLAALLLTLNVFHLQLSRFFTVDIFLTTATVALLLSVVRIMERGSVLQYLLSGALIGLGLACKVSALSLFIPLFTAGLIRVLPKFFEKDYRGLIKESSLIICAVLLVPLVFFILAPYSFLDWNRFFNNIHEEMDKVRGISIPPYMVQFIGTTPIIYHLKQMFSYTLGAPLFVLTLCAFIYALGRLFIHRRSEEIILMAWTLPVFLIMGSYQVKFPRYLLPFYPVMFLYSANLLRTILLAISRLTSRWVEVGAGILVIIFIALKTFGFMSIYNQDHVWQTASRWMYTSIPEGSSLIGPHWDDTLPLHLPGFAPSLYRAHTSEWEIPIYEPDTPAKLTTVAERMARADYFFFSTQRIPGSIMQVPERYPDSSHLLQLLYAGHLGYEMVQTFKITPALGTLIWNDDVANESFTEYDHPKVWIFKNVLHFSAEEIKRRVYDADLYQPLPDRSQILSSTAGVLVQGEEHRDSSFISVVLWFLLLEVLSLICAPFIALLLPLSRDRGYGLSKVMGVFTIGYLSWIGAQLGLFSVSPRPLWVITILLGILAHVLVQVQWEGWQNFFKPIHEYIYRTELLFLGGAFIFVILRVCNPEIFWGEKPMDFTFLNFFTRNSVLPPEDPWAAGQTMHYYYLGTYFFAVLLKMTGIDPAIGYNLAMATIGPLILASAYSFLCALCRGWRGPIIGACLLYAISNFQVTYLTSLVFTGTQHRINFDLFWAATRLFTSPSFAEYPLWSVLFADLHAHVISVPFTLLLLGLSTRFFRKDRGHEVTAIFHAGLYALVLASLLMLNTWDFITFSIVTAALLLVRTCTVDSDIFFGSYSVRFRLFKMRILHYLVMTAVVGASLIHFSSSSASPERVGYNWVRQGEFNTLMQVFMHLGVWLVPIAFSLTVLQLNRGWRLHTGSIVRLALSLVLSLFPFLLALFSVISGTTSIPWGIIALSSVLIGAPSFICLRTNSSRGVKMAGVLILVTGFMLPLTELVFLIDRMNTIFKFYSAFWSMLALATAILIPNLVQILWIERKWDYKGVFGCVGLSFVGLTLLVGVCGSLINIYIMTRFQRTEQPKFTMNGTAYLDRQNRGEAALYRWLRHHISGTPTLLEAQGLSYGSYTRVAMHSGLPVVLGWEHHVKQRGLSQIALEERRENVRKIYETSDVLEAARLAGKYRVELIVVGDLERQTYKSDGLRKFKNRPDLFPLLFSSEGVELYTTFYSSLNPRSGRERGR